MLRIHSNLAQKLRFSTFVILAFVLLGSLAAYMKMRQASQLSQEVAANQMPALTSMRDLRLHAIEASTALKSYLLFGIDPAMGQRYRQQFELAQSTGEEAAKQLEAMRASSSSITFDGAKLDAMLKIYRVYQADQKQVEQMAIGQGDEATGKAFDLLQGDVAQQYDKLSAMLTDMVQQQVQTTDASLQQTVHLNQLQAIFMWVSTIFGGLLGLLLSEMTVRRVVRSVLLVADRAQAISDGDLTGHQLALDSDDEVTGLARSINKMQLNLREMIGTMMETASTVNSDAAALALSSQATSHRTQEQAQQTQLAAAGMQEMSISINEVSQHAQNAASSAREASGVARQGGQIVETMLDGMKSIVDSVHGTGETVRKLGKESEQIIRIVNVIEEIAQKTNLLALNAAIEAARAGEQGRGFAVVAGEVRRLAESTRDATSEIAQTIQAIQERTRGAVIAMEQGTELVTQGVETTHQAGDSLKQIIQAAEQVDSMIAQIAVAASQQAEAAKRSSENVEVINRLGEEAASAIPETNSIVQSVETGAKRLQEHIAHFRIEEKRQAVHISQPPPPRPTAALAFNT